MTPDTKAKLDTIHHEIREAIHDANTRQYSDIVLPLILLELKAIRAELEKINEKKIKS
jgi:hypothetical protein